MKSKEDGVCNLELAKRLKELGEKQECLWYWQYNGKNSHLKEYTLELDKKTYGISKKDCYAPTVAELGETLPATLIINDKDYCLEISKDDDKNWYVNYLWDEFDGGNYLTLGDKFKADTEANAMAKMRIYLLENKLIKES